MRTFITMGFCIVAALGAAEAQAQIVAGGGMANPSTTGALNMGLGANVASGGAYSHSGVPMAGFGGSNLNTASTSGMGVGATVAGAGYNRAIGGVAGRFGQNINTATGMDMHVAANATSPGLQPRYLNSNPRTRYYNPISQGAAYGSLGGGIGGMRPGSVSPNYGGSSMFGGGATGGGRTFARGAFGGGTMNGARYGSSFLPGGY